MILVCGWSCSKFTSCQKWPHDLAHHLFGFLRSPSFLLFAATASASISWDASRGMDTNACRHPDVPRSEVATSQHTCYDFLPFFCCDMGVSNRDTPQSSFLMGFSIINPIFWDTPHLWKPTHVMEPFLFVIMLSQKIARLDLLLAGFPIDASKAAPCRSRVARKSPMACDARFNLCS